MRDATGRLRRRLDLLSDDAGTELVVFDARRGLAHVLNETAGAVFLLCDGRPVDSIVAELALIPGASPDTVRRDVEQLLQSFVERDLLETA